MIKPSGKYIFGIIPSVSAGGKSQIDGGVEQIQLVDSGKFTAIVTETDVIDYKNASREFLAHLLVRHQQTLERIMAEGHTVIPLKLGTVVKNENEVQFVLERGAALLQNIIGQAGGKVEIDLLAVWSDFQAVLKKIGEEREIVDFKQSLLSKSGPITERDQQQAGLMVKLSLTRKRDLYAKKISDRLQSAGQATVAHEAINDQIVFNTSFLIDSGLQSHFDEQVKAVNDEFGEALNFRSVGPLPCYSFYTLEVDRVDFNQLDQARKILGLAVSASQEDIKKAYKSKALDVHPDRQPEAAARDGQFKVVNQAFKLLMAYCSSFELKSAPGSLRSFRREDVDSNPIIVKLRG